MGLSFTIDSPIKVAQYGISSVISIVDDVLIEKMREFYCNKFNLKFKPITIKDIDFRAERITAYLNLVDKIVREKFNELKNSLSSKSSEIEKYFSLLPSYSELKKKFNDLVENNFSIEDLHSWVKENRSEEHTSELQSH